MGLFTPDLTETSTVRGLVGFALLVGGVSLAPEQKEAVITAVVAVDQVIKVFLPDRLAGTFVGRLFGMSAPAPVPPEPFPVDPARAVPPQSGGVSTGWPGGDS